MPPSPEEIENMEICKRIQNEDKPDESLEAFLDAEETNDDEDTTAGTSQQQASTKEPDIVELDENSSSATESDETLKAQFVRKRRTQGIRVPKKMSANTESSSAPSQDLRIQPLKQAATYEAYQPYQASQLPLQTGCSITEKALESQKQLAKSKFAPLPKMTTTVRRAKR